MKQNLKKLKRIYVHNGLFHLDDILCCSILRLFNKNISIRRSAQGHKNTSATICCDIGGGYFDHHNNKNEGVICASSILYKEFKRQIDLKIQNADFEDFIKMINLQDLTGKSIPQLEAFKSLNACFFENQEENFKKAVLIMDECLLIFKNGGSMDTVLTRLGFIASRRAKIKEKEEALAFEYLKNKKRDVWELPKWLPAISLYHKRGLDLPAKIIFKTERGYTVQSWNYNTLSIPEGDKNSTQWKDTIVFCNTLREARAIKVWDDYGEEVLLNYKPHVRSHFSKMGNHRPHRPIRSGGHKHRKED